MNKVIVVIMAVLVLGVSVVWVQEVKAQNMSQIQTAPIEVGNKTCPVSHEQVGQMGPAIKYEYNGKIYNLCCPMCKHTFASDPAKYAKIAEDDAAQNGKYQATN